MVLDLANITSQRDARESFCQYGLRRRIISTIRTDSCPCRDRPNSIPPIPEKIPTVRNPLTLGGLFSIFAVISPLPQRQFTHVAVNIAQATGNSRPIQKISQNGKKNAPARRQCLPMLPRQSSRFGKYSETFASILEIFRLKQSSAGSPRKTSSSRVTSASSFGTWMTRVSLSNPC